MYTLKYHKKKVKWEGVFMEMKEFYTNSVLFVKMNPSDSSQLFPDLALMIDKNTPDKLQSLNAIKRMINRGDIIRFEANFLRLGTEFIFHELELLNTELTGS